MNLRTASRFARTLSHATTEQIVWRAVHVARSQVYKRLPREAMVWLRPEREATVKLAQPLPLEAALTDDGKATSTLWSLGRVQYHGVDGSNRDWIAHDKSRLWQYERHYHSEIVALAAQDQLAAIKGLVDDWQRKCPPLKGPSWEPYPLARRILNWSVCLVLQPKLGELLAPLLAPQVRHLARHLEKHLMGNHLLCDLFALSAASSILKARGMEGIYSQSQEGLRHHLRQQLLADGGYVERTPQYHMIVLRDLLWTSAICKATGNALGLDREAAAMLGWARAVCRADGSFPWINDAAADATLSLSAVERLAMQLDIDCGRPPASSSSLLLPETGWLIHREENHELLFDFGVIGPSDQPGHGHCDALHFELFWDGVPLVTDTGITTYAVGPRRSYERAAKAHATIAVDDEGADDVWASFRVAGRGTPELLNVSDGDGACNVIAKCRSFRGWVHTRRLTFRPGISLLVDDEVKGAPAGSAAFTFLPLAPLWQLNGDTLVCESARKSLSFTSSAPPVQQLGWQSRGFEAATPRIVLAVPLTNGRASYEVSLR